MESSPTKGTAWTLCLARCCRVIDEWFVSEGPLPLTFWRSSGGQQATCNRCRATPHTSHSYSTVAYLQFLWVYLPDSQVYPWKRVSYYTQWDDESTYTLSKYTENYAQTDFMIFTNRLRLLHIESRSYLHNIWWCLKLVPTTAGNLASWPLLRSSLSILLVDWFIM